MDKKIDYMCEVCGSTDIFWDAEACWDTETQRFEMNNVFESSTCVGNDGDCGHTGTPRKLTAAPAAYSFRKGDGDD